MQPQPQASTLSQPTAFLPWWPGSQAPCSQLGHPAITFWGSFPRGARNNLYPPPASLWVTMNRLNWAQHWPAFPLWCSVQLSTSVPSSSREPRTEISCSESLSVCLSFADGERQQRCYKVEILIFIEVYHNCVCRVQCNITQIHSTRLSQAAGYSYFFFNLRSLTLQFEIISKQCCQENSEALGPVFISQYQTVSRKSCQNICSLKRLPKGVKSENKHFRNPHS